jgi:chemotaxis protein histidine kinase CheA
MFRLPRPLATLATLLLASATTAATVDAATTDTSAKPAAAKVAKGKPVAEGRDKKHAQNKKKIVALLKTEKGDKKGAKKLPALPTPPTKADAKKIDKGEKPVVEKAEKAAEKKAEEKAEKAEKAAEKKAEEKAEKAAAAEKKAEKKGEKGDKKADKKADKDEPPPELTGALPQAKLADKKAKKTDDKSEKADKADAKKVDKKDDKSDKKTDKKDDKVSAKAKKDDDKPAKAEVSFGRAPKDKQGALAAKMKMKTCFNGSVSFSRMGQPADVSFPLTTCDGKPTPVAVESLSVLARPYDVPAPKLMPASNLAKGPKGQRAFATTKGEFAPGIKRVDPGLVMRLQAISSRFPGKTITLVSGYRPASKGSLHASAQAFDIRVDGVTNETLVAFCKTLKDTGCGYYPNSFFVHVDVRAPGTGHVYWIDISGPGEKPNYVKSWPPPLPSLPPTAGEAKDVNAASDKDAKVDPKMEKQIASTTDEATIEAVPESTETN